MNTILRKMAGRAAKRRSAGWLTKCAMLVLLALPFGQASALACLEAGTNANQVVVTLPANVAVAADAPNGTPIWESATYTMNVHCWHDWGGTAEAVYFYVNPVNQPLAAGTDVGIRFNGTIYTSASGRIATGYTLGAGTTTTVDFPITYTVVVQKSGATPASGTSSFGPSGFRVFQVDGSGGINSNPATNVNAVLMGSIRFICSSANLTFGPGNVVDFGTMTGLTVGTTLTERAITMTATRTCTTPYALRASIRPNSSTPAGTMYDASTFRLTNGLGLSFVDAVTSNEVPMNVYNDFGDMGTSLAISKTYRARVKQMDLASKLVAGTFTTEFVVDLEYY